MSVGRLCSRRVVVASPQENVRVAARRMAGHNVGAIVVKDTDDRPMGIVTDRDVAIRCVAEERNLDGTTLWDGMTQPVNVVREDTPIEEAISKMALSASRRLPVVDEAGRLIGLLALDDVLDLLTEEAEMIGTLLDKESPLLQPSGSR